MERRVGILVAALGVTIVIVGGVILGIGLPLGDQPASDDPPGTVDPSGTVTAPNPTRDDDGTTPDDNAVPDDRWRDRDVPMTDLSPVQAGKRLTNGNCEGTGAGTLTYPPMDPEDIGVITSYGMTTGAHVTPIDHWYFAPENFHSAPDTYPVYAMSDGQVYLMDYDEGNTVEETGAVPNYGVYISHSCTHLYYETLLTSLSPRLHDEFERERNGDRAYVSIPVTAGEQIGHIGGQTIDFAVLDTTRTLDGYVSPELYEIEAQKLFTADPFHYMTPALNETILERYPRRAELLGGKIDYDIEGRLRGNWFIEGSNGYRGGPVDEPPPTDYWKGHLAIYPNHFDPSATMISVGDFDGASQQLATRAGSPDPASVGVGDGPITYQLADLEYVTSNGSRWDRLSDAESLTVAPAHGRGCALFEMPAPQTLHAEFFPGTPCEDVNGFTEEMRVYER